MPGVYSNVPSPGNAVSVPYSGPVATAAAVGEPLSLLSTLPLAAPAVVR